jgi:hypothetical protein
MVLREFASLFRPKVNFQFPFRSKLTFGIAATLMDKVDTDFALFRKAFNERILWVLML